MTATYDTDDDTAETLLSAWRAETAAHAHNLRQQTELALRGLQDSDALGFADWLVLKGPEIEGGEDILVSKDRIELGPFVRVYDATGNNGDGTYVWAKGCVLIPDHAIEAVVMAREGTWARVAELSHSWPVKPCSESLVRYPSSDADDAETDEDRAQADWCPDCEHTAPIVRNPKGGWVRVAHRRNGERMSVD